MRRRRMVAMTHTILREGWRYQIGWTFRKVQKEGRGSFSIRKFILQILDLYKGLFLDVFRKKLQYDYSKMRGGEGGSKAIWNFSENLSDLVAWPLPNVNIVIPKCKYKPKSIIEIVASPLWMHHVIATAIITARARVEERCWRGRELEVLSVTAGLAPFPRQPRQFQPVSHPTCFSSKLALGLFSYWLFIFVQLTDHLFYCQCQTYFNHRFQWF